MQFVNANAGEYTKRRRSFYINYTSRFVSKPADLRGLEAKIMGEKHQVNLFTADEEEQLVRKELILARDVNIPSQRSCGNFHLDPN